MRTIFSICLLCSFCTGAHAQVKGSPQLPRNNNNQQPTGTSIRLSDTGTYQAKAGGSTLNISDPTIRALNNRGNWGRVPMFGNNSLLGLPKGTYGFNKGQLWLRPTDATSIGGITGNPSVATGSSGGSIGMGGNTLGVNGKSPYAGPTMWGSAQGINQPDSFLRRSRQIPR